MTDTLRKALAELREARAVLAHTNAHCRIETQLLRRQPVPRQDYEILTIWSLISPEQ